METDLRQSTGRESKSTANRDNPEGETVPDGLPLDQVFEILKNSRRRRTLAYLNRNGGNTTLSDLAEHIAAIENDVSVKAITSDQRKRVYVALYQSHLPKMDGMDIVRYDKNRGTVELSAAAPQLSPYLGDSVTFRWSRFYFAVAAVGIGLVTLSAVGTFPLGLSTTTVSLTLLAAVGVCATIHGYVESENNRFVQ